MPYTTLSHGARVHYSITHPPADRPPRPTLLFHHGMGSSQNFYYSIIPALAAHGFTCIAFDAVGSGRSAPIIDRSVFSIATLADNLVEVMDALKLDGSIVLIGHSLSSLVVPRVLTDDGSIDVGDRQVRKFVAAIMIGPVLPSPGIVAALGPRIEAIEKEGMEGLANIAPVATTGSRSKPLHHAFIRELLLATSPETYTTYSRAVMAAEVPKYEKVKTPMLLITGDEDKSAPPASTREILERIGAVEKEMVVLPGVGHQQCIECPEGVLEAMLAFLDRI